MKRILTIILTILFFGCQNVTTDKKGENVAITVYPKHGDFMKISDVQELHKNETEDFLFLQNYGKKNVKFRNFTNDPSIIIGTIDDSIEFSSSGNDLFFGLRKVNVEFVGNFIEVLNNGSIAINYHSKSQGDFQVSGWEGDKTGSIASGALLRIPIQFFGWDDFDEHSIILYKP